MENPIERGPEHILTKEEVIEKIKTFAESYEIRRELSDENGLYLFEVVVPGEKEGGTIEYTYLRKGENPSKNRTAVTNIFKAFYDKDGVPEGGEELVSYDEVNGIWNE